MKRTTTTLAIATLLLGLFAFPMPGAHAEPADCNDTIDNDGDGFTDYPDDPDCSSPQDDSEITTDPAHPACDDNEDNDGDGWTDYPEESGCFYSSDETETMDSTGCSDGADNDGDGKIDYPADDGCYGEDDMEETDLHGDPACAFNGTGCNGMVLEKREGNTLFGAVGAGERCTYQRSVQLKKVRPGPDRVVARFRTDSMGEFWRGRPPSAGRYYAVAKKTELEDLTCSWDRSNNVRYGRDR